MSEVVLEMPSDDDWSIPVHVQNEDSTDVDLTGRTLTAHYILNYEKVDMTVIETSLTEGKVLIELDDVYVSSLKINNVVTMFLKSEMAGVKETLLKLKVQVI